LEIAVLGPALLLLVFAVVQVSLWAYARSLALAAAQEGAAAAAQYGAEPHDGTQRALRFVADSAGDSLQDVSVREPRPAGDMVHVEVSGRSLSVIPGVPGIPVSQLAQAPRERFVPDLAP
jgi:hypothetical protein